MRQVQEKKLERSVQLRKERILRKKIRNGRVPSNTAVNEEEEEQMEQMDKNCHPELLQKIKDKKNEQSLERRAQRNERRRKSQGNAVEEDEEDEVELEE
ncbi:hypothetical protein ACLKA6_018856 [Drosophila palustris]